MGQFTSMNKLYRVPNAKGNRDNGEKKIPVRENTGNLVTLPQHRPFFFFIKN